MYIYILVTLFIILEYGFMFPSFIRIRLSIDFSTIWFMFRSFIRIRLFVDVIRLPFNVRYEE